jgi:hypothetical protein
MLRISPPISAGPGSYRLTAGVGGRQVGSVMVHTRDRGAVEVTDLGVDPTERGQNIGRRLVASAARTGLQFGRSRVTLAAQDNGSGHLTHWYKGMGFTETGVNQHGYPQMEAPISRLLAGVAQRVPAASTASRSVLIQLSSNKKGGNKTPAPKPQKESKWQTQQKEAAAKKAQEDKEKTEKIEQRLRQEKLNKQKNDEQAEVRKAKEKEAREKAAETKQKELLVEEGGLQAKPRRRLEGVARLLESPSNICVALAVVDGQYIATTNEGLLAPLVFDQGTLWVCDPTGSTGQKERYRSHDAAKVFASFEAKELPLTINDVKQVEKTGDHQVHAELKLLNWLVKNNKKGTIEVYVSKLCCKKCRIAISEWNNYKSKTVALTIVTPGTHGDYYQGWYLPDCFNTYEDLTETILSKIESLDSPSLAANASTREGRASLRAMAAGKRSQRTRSVSPAPELKTGTVRNYSEYKVQTGPQSSSAFPEEKKETIQYDD